MENIRLQIPDDENLPNEVNQGNHFAELVPGGELVVKDRAFADFLIREFKLEELPTTAENLSADLSKLKVAALVEKAKSAGIENAEKLKKTELINALVSVNQPAETDSNNGEEE